MKRYLTCISVLLLAGTLASCGGGGDSGSSGSNGGGGAGTPGRFEESATAVSLSAGQWTRADSNFGWSGGTAMQSAVQGATASFTFNGTSVTWIGARSESSGTATVRVDGGMTTGKDLFQVDLFARPHEIRTPIITIHDLAPGRHTLTIQVTGNENVVVDAFDVDAPIVSHLQETDPNVVFSGAWTQDASAAWSGGGVATLPDPPEGGARFADAAGAKITLTFRGTSITWQGGHGPDGGIAAVQVDGGAVAQVDTFGPTQKFQEVMFAQAGLADATHTLTIQVTGQKNAASTGTKIVVDAFDVTKPGRRHQQDDPNIAYAGSWTRGNVNRVWSEGAANTSQDPGSRATFTFTGTGVSYIGCQKSSIGPVRIFLDGALVQTIDNFKPEPIEAYQNEIFRVDGLTPGQHTLAVEAVSSTSFIVVDAFDVRP